LNSFVTIDDNTLAEAIRQATERIVYVAPGLGPATATALIEMAGPTPTIVLDPDPDVCRIGFGDVKGFELIAKAIANRRVAVQRKAGLRVGVLVADDSVLVWAPTAEAVDRQRTGGEPNGVSLRGDGRQSLAESLSAQAATVLGPEQLNATMAQAVVEDLKTNPPAPFDLSQRARVFSTRFQFVEFEVRGAEWTERKVGLSSFLMNADLPEAIRDILETQVRPFQHQGDVECDVPGFLNGQPAFDASGKRILVKATQADVLKRWDRIRETFLRRVPGYGWLIRRDAVDPFKADIASFEEVLKAWVDAFRAHVNQNREAQVKDLVDAILRRAAGGRHDTIPSAEEIRGQVADGLDRLRVIAPCVRLVFKDVAWESSRDREFLEALESALTPDERKGWFEEFSVARERLEQSR
jgi:hypothetical protein